MEVPVYNVSKEIVRNIQISDDVFGAQPNEAIVHQAMVRQLANARHGTAAAKTRGQVDGSTKKLFRQKGTGSARAGNRRSPIRKGGGIVFPPIPRSYAQSMPKKMRQQALRCVLSGKVTDGELMVLDELKIDKPKTKDMVNILTALGVETTALIATPEADENIIKSARNLPGVKTTPANLLNVVDMLSHNRLLITEAAVRKIEQLWGKEPEGEK